MDERAHNQGRTRCVLAAVLLFACNLYLLQGLFQFEYIDQMGSVQGAFIAFARYIRDNWDDLNWFPPKAGVKIGFVPYIYGPARPGHLGGDA